MASSKGITEERNTEDVVGGVDGVDIERRRWTSGVSLLGMERA
jgi:hypothetical protein